MISVNTRDKRISPALFDILYFTIGQKIANTNVESPGIVQSVKENKFDKNKITK